MIPSFYGALQNSENPAYVFDDNAIHNPFSNIDIRNPMAKDGTVEDWDVATKLWEYAITSRLVGPKQKSIRHSNGDHPGSDVDAQMEGTENDEKPLSDSPLIMTEPGWNSAKNREKSLEIAMENWGCPAFYLGRSGVLAA